MEQATTTTPKVEVLAVFSLTDPAVVQAIAGTVEKILDRCPGCNLHPKITRETRPGKKSTYLVATCAACNFKGEVREIAGADSKMTELLREWSDACGAQSNKLQEDLDATVHCPCCKGDFSVYNEYDKKTGSTSFVLGECLKDCGYVDEEKYVYKQLKDLYAKIAENEKEHLKGEEYVKYLDKLRDFFRGKGKDPRPKKEAPAPVPVPQPVPKDHMIVPISMVRGPVEQERMATLKKELARLEQDPNTKELAKYLSGILKMPPPNA